MHPMFNVTEETLEYTHCQFKCPWNQTCNRFRTPQEDDERVYMYFVAPPKLTNNQCEMYDPK